MSPPTVCKHSKDYSDALCLWLGNWLSNVWYPTFPLLRILLALFWTQPRQKPLFQITFFFLQDPFMDLKIKETSLIEILSECWSSWKAILIKAQFWLMPLQGQHFDGLEQAHSFRPPYESLQPSKELPILVDFQSSLVSATPVEGDNRCQPHRLRRGVQYLTVQGIWSRKEAKLPINILELGAIKLALNEPPFF